MQQNNVTTKHLCKKAADQLLHMQDTSIVYYLAS